MIKLTKEIGYIIVTTLLIANPIVWVSSKYN